MSTQTIDVKNFMYIESPQIPLVEIPFEEVKKMIIDPFTGKPYKGIVLEGCFADLSNIDPNNNKRFYDIPTYLELVKILKKQIFSPKGLYGHLEHPPKSYAVDSNEVSHKILDIWWDEVEKKVMGRVILLDTPNGLKAQQIYRTGGQLGISARAAGEEKKNADGTFACKVKLLTTFDLVYHPGFSSSVLKFKELNESQKFIQDLSESKHGFSGIVYEEDIMSLETKFTEYLRLNESQIINGQVQTCFYEWLFESEKTLEKEKLKKDEETIQDNEPGDQQKIQQELSNATNKDLKQSCESNKDLKECQESKNKFFDEIRQSEQDLAYKKLGNSYYQGAAGFIPGNEFSAVTTDVAATT